MSKRLMACALLSICLVSCSSSSDGENAGSAVGATSVDRDQVESLLKNAATAAESYAVSQGSYEGLDQAALQSQGFQPSPDVFLSITADATHYCIEAVTEDGQASHYDSAVGTPEEGACS